MTDTRPEHDAEIEVCGEVYLVRRTHDLLRRIEQRFGALLPLAGRVERMDVRQAELALIFEEVMRGNPEAPPRAGIERWIWDEGTPKVVKGLARLLYELPIGNRTLRLLEDEKRIAAAEQREREESVRPTAPALAPDRASALAEALATAMSRTTGSSTGAPH